MDGLIKKSDALRVLCENCSLTEECEQSKEKCEAFDAIIDLDPVPERKSGKWIDEGFLTRKTCSLCGTWVSNFTGTAKLHYCPNCGADMR